MSSSRQANEPRRARSLIRRYLRFGNRSTAEGRAYLTSHHVPIPLIRTVLAEATREGVLDDRACAKLVATRLAEQGYAWAAIHQRLLAKGFDERLIARTHEFLRADADDASRARALVRDRLRGRSAADERLRGRLARALVARGFDPDLIAQVLVDALGPSPHG